MGLRFRVRGYAVRVKLKFVVWCVASSALYGTSMVGLGLVIGALLLLTVLLAVSLKVRVKGGSYALDA